jgi:hypothetical protein
MPGFVAERDVFLGAGAGLGNCGAKCRRWELAQRLLSEWRFKALEKGADGVVEARRVIRVEGVAAL